MPILKAGICSALTPQVLESLSNGGVRNVVDFIAADPEDLSQRTGVAFKDVLSIRRVLLAQYSAFPVNGGDLYEDVMSSVAILSTGCQSLDELLDGGLYTTEVTEVMGSAAAGKTQLCLTSAITVAMETKQNILFVDTSGAFDGTRLQEMLAARNWTDQEAQAICSKIKCVQAFDVFELLTVLQDTRDKLDQQADFYSSLKLVIVDSVAAVIAPILGGYQTDGHGYMMHVARMLAVLATEYALAVLITNNVVYGGGQPRAALGNTWQHVPDCRLSLSRPDSVSNPPTMESTNVNPSLRHATLLKSLRQAVDIGVTCQITNKGVE